MYASMNKDTTLRRAVPRLAQHAAAGCFVLQSIADIEVPPEANF